MTDPLEIFTDWYQLASQKEVYHNAMTLSTCSGRVPYSRTVLLKGVDKKGFVFFTNYNSPKSCDIETNEWVSLLFFWPKLERQVRIVGKAKKTSREESVAYFKTRPYFSQIASMASKQSAVLGSYAQFNLECIATLGVPICPDNWGGWVIEPEEFEFLEMRPNRMHVRNQYEMNSDGEWNHNLLYP